MNDGSWFVACRDVAGRQRILRVVVRGSEVVVVAPPGEVAALDHDEADQFRSAVADAITLATSLVARASDGAARTGMASPAEQYNDGVPPAVEGALLCCHVAAGATTPAPGPAATPGYEGGHE
ncbi:hypothetical protein ACIA8G_21655 [Lentzea sp. NPDC051213]|uniref:hypothetical protein n=1 Tax=Lentzea sp. NPDC051213 TaxID=3364126 RepID=UPI0037A01F6C